MLGSSEVRGKASLDAGKNEKVKNDFRVADGCNHHRAYWALCFFFIEDNYYFENLTSKAVVIRFITPTIQKGGGYRSHVGGHSTYMYIVRH
jgi:hypothetical protein